MPTEDDKGFGRGTIASSADANARAVGRRSPTARERDSAQVLKVSTRSQPSAVAGAIAGVIRDNSMAEVQSIGAGATNQAIKAVAIARSYLSEEGIDIIITPSFIDVSIDEEERTAIRLLVEKRPGSFIEDTSTGERAEIGKTSMKDANSEAIYRRWASIPKDEQYFVWLAMTDMERKDLFRNFTSAEQQSILNSLHPSERENLAL